MAAALCENKLILTREEKARCQGMDAGEGARPDTGADAVELGMGSRVALCGFD